MRSSSENVAQTPQVSGNDGDTVIIYIREKRKEIIKHLNSGCLQLRHLRLCTPELTVRNDSGEMAKQTADSGA